MSSLLPDNASDFEKHVEEAIDARFEILNNHVFIRQLWDTVQCPTEYLDILAWTLSVDEWLENWSEEQKRRICQQSANSHAIKGSRQSIINIIASLGEDLAIKEWWQSKPGTSVVHTFTISITDTSNALQSMDYQQKIKRLVEKYKPLRSHFELVAVQDFTGDIFLASSLQVLASYENHFIMELENVYKSTLHVAVSMQILIHYKDED